MNELSTLYCNQEETYTRVLLRLHHAAALGYKNAVVRTPDTDIFVSFPFHMHAINMSIHIDAGSAKHRRLFTFSEVAESLVKEKGTALLGFYVFSGDACTVQLIQGKGEAGPLRQLEKNPRFHIAYRQLGV